MTRRPSNGFVYFLAFLLIAAVYFYRIFTQGAVPVFGDGVSQIYPMRFFAAQAGLVPPLWNPYVFAGMPFVGLMQTAALYPPNIVLYALLPAVHAFNASFLLHFALAGYFTFMLLRELGLSKTAAFFGASVFAFSGFVISTKQHVAILNASAWLPLIIYLAERLKKSPGPRYALGLSLAVAMQVLAGNFQVCVYTYIVLAVYLIFSLRDVEKGGRMRFASLLAGGGALGLLMAAPQIYATWQTSGESLRPVVAETLGYTFAKEFHVYLKTLPSVVLPHLYSRAELGTRLPVPGDRMIVFTGILPLALSLLAVAKRWRSNTIKLWAAIGVLGLVLATADDTPLGRLLFHVPVYGMFHANGRNMLELSLAVSVLFAFGIDHVLLDKRNIRAALTALAGVLAASVLALAITYYGQGKGARAAIAISNPAVYVPMLFFALYALGLVITRSGKKRVLALVLFALVMAEAYSFGAYHEAGWTPSASLTAKCEERGYDFLKSAESDEPFRVAWADTNKRGQFNVPCGVSVLNSYDQLIPADYAYLFDLEPFGFSRYWENLIRGNSLLSMMNVKYLMVPSGSERGIEDISTTAAPVRLGDPVAVWRGPFLLPDPNNPDRDRFSLTGQLLRGTYVLTVRAKSSGEEGASLAVDIYNEKQAQLRVGSRPYNAYPGTIGSEPKEYYRVYHSDGPQLVSLGFSALRKEPVEISDIVLGELEGFGPGPMGASGKVYEKVRELGGYGVYLNKNTLPRAYSVTKLVGAGDIGEIKKMFDLNLINPSGQAVLYNEDLPAVGDVVFSRADVSITRYKNEKVELQTASPGKSFIVLSDQYSPEWRALIDGNPARIYRTNGVVRGVVVPAGDHTVVFKYSSAWRVYLAVSALLVIAAAVFVLILRSREGQKA